MKLVYVAILSCIAVVLTSCKNEELTVTEKGVAVEIDEYRERSLALRMIDNRISTKVDSTLGPDGTNSSKSDYNKARSEIERHWEVLRYYYEAALVNSGDIITYIPLVYEYPEAFRAIGAIRTLEAAEKLRPYVEMIQSFNSQDEKDDYWTATLAERKPIEDAAENSREFAQLLINFGTENIPDLNIDAKNSEQDHTK